MDRITGQKAIGKRQYIVVLLLLILQQVPVKSNFLNLSGQNGE